jgi:Haloacid dehalogenase-like hydrolase
LIARDSKNKNSAELFDHYKPDREVYLGAVEMLDLRPEQVMMAASHNFDLAAAQKLGLKTGFVLPPMESGPSQTHGLCSHATYRPAYLIEWAQRKKVDPAQLQTSVPPTIQLRKCLTACSPVLGGEAFEWGSLTMQIPPTRPAERSCAKKPAPSGLGPRKH